MIQLYDFLRLIPVFLFTWIISFLAHEFFHIKARLIQGYNDTGNIQVYKYSMSAYRDNVTNDSWFFLAGGLLSGVLFIFMGFFCSDKVWMVSFFTAGAVNICYGFFEMFFLPRWGDSRKYRIGRYSIYITVSLILLVCLLWWM